ncbi:MAG: glycerophosphodiester phosphodiesterase [Deltaproteobacteria bacterium]|nr:glycerophosphodiester phosphodiesterase [Deltaproteobacteria bacterium]
MLKIGHRGAMGYATENTMTSFVKALELGVDGIELDVHVCKSGEVVVIHDERVDRTTDGKGYVLGMTLEELKNLDAGDGQRILTLQEVLDFVNRRAMIDIELKAEGIAESVSEVVRHYIREQGWKNDLFMISSFDHHELKRCHDIIPEVPFGPIIAAKPLDYAYLAQAMQADTIKPFFEFLDSPFVQDAHRRGLKVFTWTVNRYDDIKKMFNIGVDGIISNYPDRLNAGG